MLTAWKQILTSFEAPHPNRPLNGVRESAKKKKKSRKSQSQSDSVDPSSLALEAADIGISFVRPLACNDLFYQERKKSAAKGNKKRRKLIGDNNSGENVSGEHDVDPVICITSPHRVVVMGSDGNSQEASDKGDQETSYNLVESKSRTYVTRPGIGSRFYLPGSEGYATKKDDGDSFSCMPPNGARYDPASNLMYALRDGGAELSIWTAAPSSCISGPDDKRGDCVEKESDENIGREKKGSAQSQSARKRKPQHQEHFSQQSPAQSNFVHSVQFPSGKRAVSLTPVSISSNEKHDKSSLLATGAAGCCDDGSIWIAIKALNNNTSYQLVIVKESSLEKRGSNGAANSRNSNKRRQSSASSKHNPNKIQSGIQIEDSFATASLNSGNGENVGNSSNVQLSFTIRVQSVLIVEDQGELLFRDHLVHVQQKGGDERFTNGAMGASFDYRIEKSSNQKVLDLDSTTGVVAKFESNGKSLNIVHQNNKSNWILSSANVIHQSVATAVSMTSFPLVGNDDMPLHDRKISSFGSMGRNVFAVLLKGKSVLTGRNGISSTIFTLKIVDIQRKVELSSVCWIESEDNEIDGANLKCDPVQKAMKGKRCHAMVTNDLDGTLVLLTSPFSGKDSFSIVTSQLKIEPNQSAISQSSNSLASALRVVASSNNCSFKTSNPPLLNLTDYTNDGQPAAVDSIEVACALLVQRAKEAVEMVEGKNSEHMKPMENGISKKHVDVGRKVNELSWKNSYVQSLAVINDSKEVHSTTSTPDLINGVRIREISNRVSLEILPSRFANVALKETINILQSLHNHSSKLPTKLYKKLYQETLSVALIILKSKKISARADFGFRSQRHAFVQLLQLSLSDGGSSVAHTNKSGGYEASEALEVIDTMLSHVQDIPERVLVNILRFVMRKANVGDSIAYYSQLATMGCKEKKERLGNSERCVSLSNKITELDAKIGQVEGKTDEDLNARKEILVIKLQSETILDFTSKIVMYSKCNHSFLIKALQDSLNTRGEVEALFLALSKLLRRGGCSESQGNEKSFLHQISSNHISLSSGAIQWISALSDAHIGTIMKASFEGGLLLDRIQASARSALAQSEFANELKEMSDRVDNSTIFYGDLEQVGASNNTSTQPSSGDNAPPYSIEWQGF